MLYNVFFTPLQIGLDIESFLPSYWVLVDYLVDLMFFMDIIFTFRTVLIDSSGNICMDKTKIYKAYFRGWFIIDIIASLPLDLLKIFFGNFSTTSYENFSRKRY